MSTSSNKSLVNQVAVAVPATLALIGLVYAPARALIGLGILAALLALFKPLLDAAFRAISLELARPQAFVRESAYALNRQANRIAQSNPELAAKLRLRAHAPKIVLAKNASADAESEKAPLTLRSKASLNSEANRIAQSQPQRAIQLRLLAAYA